MPRVSGDLVLGNILPDRLEFDRLLIVAKTGSGRSRRGNGNAFRFEISESEEKRNDTLILSRRKKEKIRSEKPEVQWDSNFRSRLMVLRVPWVV